MEIPHDLLADFLKLGIKLAELGIGAIVCFKLYFWARGKYEGRNKLALEALLEQFKTQASELKSSGTKTQDALGVTNGKLGQVHTDVEVLKAQVAPLSEMLPRTTTALERLNDFYQRQTEAANALKVEAVAPGVNKLKGSSR